MPKIILPAAQIADDFVKLISGVNSPLTVFVSGGSVIDALAPAFAKLSEIPRTWQGITIALVDERYSADASHSDANFSKLTSLKPVFQLQASMMEFKSVLVPNIGLIGTGALYSEYLERVFSNPEMKTVGIFGVGSDFHVAGILPHKDNFEYMFHESLAVGYDSSEISHSENPFHERITMSFTAIDKLQHRWLYAVGDEKRKVLEEIVPIAKSLQSLNEKPALVLRQYPELRIYTDQEVI